MDVALLLKERAVKTMDLDMEWALAPVHTRFPLPIPAAIVPGGSVTYEDRNFREAGDHMSASLMCSNFLHPTDDLSARVQYRKPFVFARSTDEDLVVDAFNARRLSSVFTGAPTHLLIVLSEDLPFTFLFRWQETTCPTSSIPQRLIRANATHTTAVEVSWTCTVDLLYWSILYRVLVADAHACSRDCRRGSVSVSVFYIRGCPVPIP